MNIYEAEDLDQAPVEITLEDLNTLRDDCKEIIETANSAKRLLVNEDFIKVVQQGYFEKEPKRLGCLIASGRMTSNAIQGAVEDLKSIGNCVNFLNDVVQKGEIAQGELDAIQDAYNEKFVDVSEE